MILQNRSRDVGQSEIKRIPILDLTQYVAVIIMHFTEKFKARRIGDTQDALLSVTPGESLPWYGLIHQIHRAGRLPKLILYFARFLGTPDATCYYNPVTASRYLSRYSRMLVKFLKPNRPVVVLSYYTTSHLTYLLEIMITEKVKIALRQDFLRYMPEKSANIRILQEDKMLALRQLMRESLVLLGILYNIDIIAEELASVVIRERYKSIRGFGIEFLDVTMLDDFLGENEGYTFEITEWVERWKSIGLSMEDIAEDTDWADLIQLVQGKYEGTVCDVHYTTVGACCLKVRSEKQEEESDSSEPERLSFQQLPADPDQVNLNKMRHPFVMSTGIDYTEPALYGEFEGTLPTRHMSSIPVHEAFCTIGSSTGSETHLLYILYNQMCFVRGNHPLWQVTCIADGFGGFSRVFLEYDAETRIIFHTLPQDNESPIIAPTTEGDIMARALITSHLDEGYYDLTLWTTFERFKQYEQVNDFVTSDLELSEDTTISSIKKFCYISSWRRLFPRPRSAMNSQMKLYTKRSLILLYEIRSWQSSKKDIVMVD